MIYRKILISALRYLAGQLNPKTMSQNAREEYWQSMRRDDSENNTVPTQRYAVAREIMMSRPYYTSKVCTAAQIYGDSTDKIVLEILSQHCSRLFNM
jgi:hypothetical protein